MDGYGTQLRRSLNGRVSVVSGVFQWVETNRDCQTNMVLKPLKPTRNTFDNTPPDWKTGGKNDVKTVQVGDPWSRVTNNISI